MLGIAGKVVGRMRHLWERHRERQLLSPLYDPDFEDRNLERHTEEALEWLKRAQDAGTDRGVAYGVYFGDDFDLSYPETTGYVCQTFVEQAKINGDSELLDRAIEMGDWEIEIQMQDGAVMGGKFNTDPTPAVFNTGMLLLGGSPLYQTTKEYRFAGRPGAYQIGSFRTRNRTGGG